MNNKNIITAIGEKSLNNNLKEKGYNVLCTDIQYREGILEFLEANSLIDYIIINEELPGNILKEDLINEIKKINKNIKIIFIENKNYNIEKIIKKINENNFEINNLIINKNELLNNKKIINNEKINKNKIIKKESIFNKKTLPINDLFKIKNVVREKQKDIISILGPNGIGKSVFSILFAKTMVGKKSIIIDFDILNNSLHVLLGVKNYEEKIKRKIKSNDLINNNNSIEKNIMHTNLKIDLLPAMNIILDPNYKLSSKKIKNIIDELKTIYDLIIIDTSSETFLDYTREIINCSNKSIFISGVNLLEIRKSERLLDIYTKDWNIEKNKINIVFNKVTKNSIDESLLKEIFNEYSILGKIRLSDYYDWVVNKNMSDKEKLQKEIDKIKEQIEKEKIYGIK